MKKGWQAECPAKTLERVSITTGASEVAYRNTGGSESEGGSEFAGDDSWSFNMWQVRLRSW